MVIICQYQTLSQMLQNLNHIISILKLPIKPSITPQQDHILQQLYTLIHKIKSKLTQNQNQQQSYVQIQKQLQRQQNLNRSLIKKQLEFKQYQKCLIQQLDQQKILTRNLKKQLHKYNDNMTKDIDVAMSNQKKTINKDKESDKKKDSQRKVRDKKNKQILGIQHFFNQIKIKEYYKNQKIVKGGHQRRRSDQIKRPSTSGVKKKSVPKK